MQTLGTVWPLGTFQSCACPGFKSGELGDKDDFSSYLGLLVLPSAHLSPSIEVIMHSWILSQPHPLVTGFPSYHVASHSRAASSLQKGHPSRLHLALGIWRLRTKMKTHTHRNILLVQCSQYPWGGCIVISQSLYIFITTEPSWFSSSHQINTKWTVPLSSIFIRLPALLFHANTNYDKWLSYLFYCNCFLWLTFILSRC